MLPPCSDQMRFLGPENALKFVCGRGSAPDPAGGDYSTPPVLPTCLLLTRVALCQRLRSVIARTRYINVLTYLHQYIYTYIHKEYSYRAYYPNSKSLYALQSLNKKVFSCRLKVRMTVQAVVDMEGYSGLVDRQPKNFYRQICCE